MGRTQALSALVLAMLAAGAISNTIYATEEESAGATQTNYTVESNSAEKMQTVGEKRSAELAEALENARKAQEYAATHKSEVYPGIDKYIEKIVAQAERGEGTEAQALEALNDATTLTYRLLENEKKNVTVSHSSATNVSTPAKAETTGANEIAKEKEEAEPEVVQAAPQKVQVATVAEIKPEEKNEQVEDEITESGVQPEEVAELPKTGAAEHEVSTGELVMVGVIVAMATAGVAALVIRSKRNA